MPQNGEEGDKKRSRILIYLFLIQQPFHSFVIREKKGASNMRVHNLLLAKKKQPAKRNNGNLLKMKMR